MFGLPSSLTLRSATRVRAASVEARRETSGPRRYDYIDALRALAILGVLGVHTHQNIAGLSPATAWLFNFGQMGVQLFFVASALTLCLSMQARQDPALANFYLRRVFRIAPLYYLGIATYFAWGTLKNVAIQGHAAPPPQYDLLGVLSNLLFVHQFYEPANNSIVPGGWSIATEMSFYLVFPLLYAIQRRLGDLGWRAFAFAVVGACFLTEIALRAISGRGPDDASIVYFSLLNQGAAFLIGIEVYRQVSRGARIGIAHAVLALGALAVALVLLNGPWHIGFNGFLLPGVSAIAFGVLAIRLSALGEFTGRAARALKRIGELSFSIYVLHFLFVEIVYFVLKRSLFGVLHQPEVQLTVYYAIVAALTTWAASWTYRLVERPGIEFGKRFLRRDRLAAAPRSSSTW